MMTCAEMLHGSITKAVRKATKCHVHIGLNRREESGQALICCRVGKISSEDLIQKGRDEKERLFKLETK
jgi:hypothetical protein